MRTIEPSSSTVAFFLALVAAAFALNWLWEMVQMPAYLELQERTWGETALTCAVASLGDVAVTLLIYAIMAVATRRLSWGATVGLRGFLVAGLLGAIGALVIELLARATGRWPYSGRMPVVWGMGLWPILQLMLLVPISIWVAARGVNGARYRKN